MKTKKLRPTKTQKRIIDMLQENTGRHMLDSGGAYGRHWERNQAIDFLKTPGFYFETYGSGKNAHFGLTLNVFWYLSEFLDITPESEKLNKLLKKSLKKGYEEGRYEVDIAEEFVNQQNDGSDESLNTRWVNTYNGDNLLSQTLQYCAFCKDDSYYICLQIHGGCDVRGGYTTPQIFAFKEDRFQETVWRFENAAVEVSASDGDNTWDSYNAGYSFDTIESDMPEFKDVVVVTEEGVYNKITGKRISFYNQFAECEFDGPEMIPALSLIGEFVHSNYNDPKLMEKAKKKFSEMFEEYELDVESMVNSVLNEVAKHTLELELK